MDLKPIFENILEGGAKAVEGGVKSAKAIGADAFTPLHKNKKK